MNQPLLSSHDKTLHLLFEEQVIRTPDNLAIVYEEKKLTYKQLNERSNQLANYLNQVFKIKPDTVIAVCLDRNEYMPIALLSILKAGGAYVPIDVTYPDTRIRYILEDTNTKLILTNGVYKQRLESICYNEPFNLLEENQQVAILSVDSEELQKNLFPQLKTNPITTTSNTNLAYVIYTSGTTGNPKGVMIEHRSIVDRIYYLINTHEITPSFRIATKTSYSFDPSLREIFLALLSGAELVILSEETYKNTDKLLDYCIKLEIDLLIFVPSHLSAFLDSLKELEGQQLAMVKIKIIYSCGEVLQKKLFFELRKYLPNVTIKNQYGPTECCLFSFEFDLNHYNTLFHNSIPIGKAVDNMDGYVLDTHLVPVPIGTIGELYIGGIGIARGYLNRPELTLEKFILNPFQSKQEKKLNKNTILYKTGDLVRWLPDGNLEYIGRNDFQIKIRGYRIELEEIENALLNYREIKQSAVLLKQPINMDKISAENNYLIGYYTSDIEFNEEDILNYLKMQLPEYMVPKRIIYLKNLPLTNNGKLDRKTLLELEITSSNRYEAPRDEIEAKICHVWEEVLGLAANKIGVFDDFFALGGNSILAIRLISKINKKLNRNINISTIFRCNTIDKLAKYLNCESLNSKITYEEWIV